MVPVPRYVWTVPVCGYGRSGLDRAGSRDWIELSSCTSIYRALKLVLQLVADNKHYKLKIPVKIPIQKNLHSRWSRTILRESSRSKPVAPGQEHKGCQ